MEGEDFDIATASSTPADELMKSLYSSSEEGLSQLEAESRPKSHGPNQLKKVKRRSLWEMRFSMVVFIPSTSSGWVSVLFILSIRIFDKIKAKNVFPCIQR